MNRTQANALYASSVSRLQANLRTYPLTLTDLEDRREAAIRSLEFGLKIRRGDAVRVQRYHDLLLVAKRPFEQSTDEEIREAFGLTGLQYIVR